jgi:hypothetical protein
MGVLKSRLRKNNLMTKKANSVFINLDSIALKSGDVIEFEVKIVANRPWFQINHESPFNVSSYYDGPDFERACEMYGELLLAFKGVRKAEELKTLKVDFERKIERLKKEKDYYAYQDHYQALKRKPLFLGMDDF